MSEEKNHDQKKEKPDKFEMRIKPLIAGILLITAGMIFIDASSDYLLIDDKEIEEYIEENNESLQNVTQSQIKQSYQLYGIIGITISAFCFLGGLLTIFRKKWKISFAFSILNIISIVFLFLIMFPLILSITAVIIIYFSKEDFIEEKTS